MRDLNDMAIFAEVIQAGGFTAAADKLDLPKSNISRRISRLESRLGVRLLERTTRRLRLTEIGEVYFQHCRRILEEADFAELSINQLVEIPRGLLRVSTSVTVGQQLLAPVMAEFLDQNPEVQLQLTLDNRFVDLIEGGFDVSIRVGKLSDSRLVARLLGTAHLLLYASKEYLARKGEPRHPSELHGHDILVMRTHSNMDQLYLNPVAAKGNEGEERFAIKPRAFINDFKTIHRLVADGVGIAILPSYQCTQDEACGSLVQVLSQWSSQPVQFHAIYPSLSGVTPKLRAFIDFISAKMAERL